MIIPATKEHLALLQIDAANQRELTEVYDMTLAEAMRRNLSASVQAWSMFAGDDLLCMFGVAPVSMLDSTGEFWVAGTVNICRHRLSFARQCKRFLPTLLADWSAVTGVLEHGREDVLRWALWLGVEVTPFDDRLSRMNLCK